MRKVRAAVLAATLAATLSGGVLYGTANAAPTSPDPGEGVHAMADGNLYVWEHTEAEGRGAGCTWAGDDADYRFNSNGCGNWNDRVSSAWNNGFFNSYPDVLFFDSIDYRQQSICLHNGEYWRSMPAGWNDRVSSHKWVDC